MTNTITIEFSAEDRARLDRLAELLEGKAASMAVETVAAVSPAVDATEKTMEAKPEKREPEQQAPDRRTVKSLAVNKIQAGKRDEVKALIQKYGAEKIDLVPEDKLADFAAELEVL